MNNILLSVDSYKISHYKQYPDGTEHIYSYIEPRKGSNDVVVFGIQQFIEKISGQLTAENVNELAEIAEAHGEPFNIEGWTSLIRSYRGKGWPIHVMGVPEGTVVKPGTPVATIVNTDAEFPWLTSFFETLFLRCVWYPSTVASNSRYCKGRIHEFMVRTGADLSTIDFKLHDFGARGATSGDAASIGGAAHLINFKGTDTIEAIKFVRDFYDEPMAGFSIPATEHSTVTSWGRENEHEMYRTFIDRNLGPGLLASCVSDSYDIDEALVMWKSLEPEILAKGGTLVIRPDSGDPITMPVHVIERLMKLFGYTTNDAGYRVLPDHIRVLQGDGINRDSLVRIMQNMMDKKMSIDNIAFGMGGGLLQSVTRDDYSWAMKCSAACVNGEWRDVYKDPKGGNKKSKRGLVTAEGNLETPWGHSDTDGWVTYYWNGRVTLADSWANIRGRAK